MKHTPAPWRFVDRSEVSDISSANSSIPFAIEKVYGNAVAPIADICNFPPATVEQTEIQRSNAKLIAAAPELLEALQEYVNSYNENRSQMKAMRMAKEAISKATL